MTLKPPETLNGQIERITFHNADNGFCVLRVNVKGMRDLVTVIGNAPNISAGEQIEAQGHWLNDKKFGLQFKTQTLEVLSPTTLNGIEKYLASGMVKGIGPHFAKLLVKRFGEHVFDVIEQQPAQLSEISGIGKKRLNRITHAWAEQKAVRHIMMFLQSHGVGTARAVRIYKTYGDQAVDKVKENPYRLALDIHGIGFKTADALAQRLGIAANAMIRIEAGVRHVLQQLSQRGHTGIPRDNFIEESQTLLEVEPNLIEQALAHEMAEKRIVGDHIDDKPCVFLAGLYYAEHHIADDLQALKQGPPPWEIQEYDRALTWVQEKTGLTLSPSQQTAIKTVLSNKVSIITGGPGVGKTTVVNSVLKIILAKKVRIALCAPTGRAAKRLNEATHHPAKTIHRLLEYEPGSHQFKYNETHPLDIDVLVVDEASMLDVNLMHQLLKAIPPRAALILVGDVDQLPSVGPGKVLADCIASQQIPTAILTEIFRQAATSKIVTNAHRINQGLIPERYEGGFTDFYVIYRKTPEDVFDALMTCITEKIPKRLRCKPIEDIQVLTPMNRGGLGTRSLNVALQQALNSPEKKTKISRFGWDFCVGDKVIQTVNNYDKLVFNGDIGVIQSIDTEEGELTIQFDYRSVLYDINELDEISLAYATSIHKSQGSEYPIVVIPLCTQHFTLLARNLVYTAVTRGKKLVVVITQMKALAIALNQQQAAQRLTKLAAHLRG